MRLKMPRIIKFLWNILVVSPLVSMWKAFWTVFGLLLMMCCLICGLMIMGLCLATVTSFQFMPNTLIELAASGMFFVMYLSCGVIIFVNLPTQSHKWIKEQWVKTDNYNESEEV
jgi:hypothetical protein